MPNRGGRWRQSLRRAFADRWRNRLFRGRSRGTYRYRCPEYLHAKSRETRRNRGLQGAGVAGARQSFRRSGGIPSSRPPLVRVVSRPWSRRRGCRRQSFVALSRGAGQRARRKSCSICSLRTRAISPGRALVPSAFRPEGKKKSAKGARSEGSLRFRHARRAGRRSTSARF
jgi:hypothetical protein